MMAFDGLFYHHLRQFQHLLSGDNQLALVITNITLANLETSHYCVVIDPSYVMYSIREPLYRHVWILDFHRRTLIKDGKTIPVRRIHELMGYLDMAFVDLQDHTARLYTKHSEPLPRAVHATTRATSYSSVRDSYLETT